MRKKRFISSSSLNHNQAENIKYFMLIIVDYGHKGAEDTNSFSENVFSFLGLSWLSMIQFGYGMDRMHIASYYPGFVSHLFINNKSFYK